MSHKQQKNKQPHLAVANMPFTPMTHKIEKPTATPYRPLQVNDLATPKINKSHSSVDKIEMIALQSEPQLHAEQQIQHQDHIQEKLITKQIQHQDYQQDKQNTKQIHQQNSKNQKALKRASNVEDSSTEKDNEAFDDTSNDLRELKNALYTCLQVVERLETREKEEELRRKTYKNIQVQTSPLPPKMTNRSQRKPTPNQLPENINSSNEIVSDNNWKPQKHYNNLVKPSGVKQNDEKGQPLPNAAINDNGDNDLQEKMKAMTILLHKLQTRIDLIDNSSQKA